MTNTTAHTPGPWWVYKEGSRFPGIEARLNGRNFSVVVYGDDKEIEGVKGRTNAEALANARLIAAAPALLEALSKAVESGQLRGCLCEAECRAAIAAAKGNKP